MDAQNSLLKFIILDDDPRGPKQSGDARGISSINHQQRRDVERDARWACNLPSMTDGLSTLYQDLLSGSYDCVDRIVLNADFRMGHLIRAGSVCGGGR